MLNSSPSTDSHELMFACSVYNPLSLEKGITSSIQMLSSKKPCSMLVFTGVVNNGMFLLDGRSIRLINRNLWIILCFH